MSYIRQLLIRQALRHKTNRPSGLIGQYKPYLNSNDSPTRDILKDYSGQGHDIQLYNFGYALQSGYGSWAQDFKNAKWHLSEIRATIDVYSTKFIVSSIKSNSACFYYQSSGGEQPFTVPSIKFRVTGLTDGQTLIFNNTGADDGTVQLRFDTDGIYTIDSFSFKGAGTYYGFQFSKLQETCNITIEQIPDYPGALVSDGVDDYGLCENFPILTKEKGYTIVAIRKRIDNQKNYLISNGIDSPQCAFFFESKNDCWNFGNVGISSNSYKAYYPELLSYQTSKSYNGYKLASGPVLEGTNVLNLFRNYTNKLNFTDAALYALEIYDHDLTDEEIQSVKEAMYNEYLTATNALQNHIIADYECYDKTNEDEDRNVLKDLSGNGHDIQLYNFGFAEGSGYGKYVVNFNSWTSASNRLDWVSNSNSVIITQVKQTTIIGFFYQKTDPNYAGGLAVTSPEFKIKISGITDGQVVRYQFGAGQLRIEKDGIYTLPSYTYNATQSGYYFYGFYFEKIQESCNIIIEQIPEYQGALVSDGVDDYGLCENFPILNKEDGYAVLAIRKLLTAENKVGSLLSNVPRDQSDWSVMFEGISGNKIDTNIGSFGEFNQGLKIPLEQNLFSYQTSKKYNQYDISVGSLTKGNNRICLFSYYNDGSYKTSYALYRVMILNKDCTTEEIKFLAKQMVAKHKEKTGETIELNF